MTRSPRPSQREAPGRSARRRTGCGESRAESHTGSRGSATRRPSRLRSPRCGRDGSVGSSVGQLGGTARRGRNAAPRSGGDRPVPSAAPRFRGDQVTAAAGRERLRGSPRAPVSTGERLRVRVRVPVRVRVRARLVGGGSRSRDAAVLEREDRAGSSPGRPGRPEPFAAVLAERGGGRLGSLGPRAGVGSAGWVRHGFRSAPPGPRRRPSCPTSGPPPCRARGRLPALGGGAPCLAALRASRAASEARSTAGRSRLAAGRAAEQPAERLLSACSLAPRSPNRGPVPVFSRRAANAVSLLIDRSVFYITPGQENARRLYPTASIGALSFLIFPFRLIGNRRKSLFRHSYIFSESLSRFYGTISKGELRSCFSASLSQRGTLLRCTGELCWLLPAAHRAVQQGCTPAAPVMQPCVAESQLAK